VLQLSNKTPFAPAICLFPDKDGVDTLYIVVRATFEIGDELRIAEEQLPPQAQDEFWGDSTSSSIKQVSDFHIGKPGTDIGLLGHAWAPDGEAVTDMYVYLLVGERQKALRVFGNRYWKNGQITRPEPFQAMPLVYERAFGGMHEVTREDGTSAVLLEERNPVGLGFRGERTDQELEGLPLPNIEDPEHLIQAPNDTPPPAGFGFIAPTWLPRREYAGTYDDKWQKTRSPYLPDDFDPRFFNCAHSDLTLDRYLEGGESVKIRNASAAGELDFYIPKCTFSNRVSIAKRSEHPPLNLETVLIEPDDNRLSLTWRAALLCDKETLHIHEVEVNLLEIEI
jgi:hypothetical protein